MNAKYKIVRATESHLAAIPAIESAAAAIFPVADLPLDVRYKVTDEETLRAAERNGQIWVAIDPQQTPVGFAMLAEVDGNPHLDEMDVLPEHGRNGIGKRLAQTIIGQLSAGGHDRLTLVTFRHLPWNAPFYATLGFEPVEACKVGPELKQVLEDERDAGIDMENRVVMLKDLR